MIDKNKKYKTRSGRDVTIMCTEARGNYPVIGIVHDEDCDKAYCWEVDGRYSSKYEGGLDLIEQPEVHTRWINFYANGTGGSVSTYTQWRTRTDADAHQYMGRIACIQVTFKEGEGL